MIQGDRLKQLEEKIPDIWDYDTLLYIGAKVVEKSRAKWGGMRMIPSFVKADYSIDILEIWQRNVDELQKLNDEKKVFNEIICGDIRNIRFLIRHTYDIVMWYHGPEHIEEESLKPILKALDDLARYIAVVACPWGYYKQGGVAGNPNEAHTSRLYSEFFTAVGWETHTLGEIDIRGSNLLAWKRTGRWIP